VILPRVHNNGTYPQFRRKLKLVGEAPAPSCSSSYLVYFLRQTPGHLPGAIPQGPCAAVDPFPRAQTRRFKLFFFLRVTVAPGQKKWFLSPKLHATCQSPFANNDTSPTPTRLFTYLLYGIATQPASADFAASEDSRDCRSLACCPSWIPAVCPDFGGTRSTPRLLSCG